MNRNYANEVVKNTSNSIDRVVNNKLEISFARNNPQYVESSKDRPNFYDPIKYKRELVLNPTLTKEQFVDDEIKLYERKKLNLFPIKNKKVLIQAFMIDNDKMIFSMRPKNLSIELGIPLKDIFKFNYLKVVNIDTEEIKYFWIGDWINNEDRRTSVTLVCVIDMWLSFYKDVILNMKGDVKILRKHFDRFLPIEDIKKPLKFNYSYESNVHNIDGGYVALQKNIVKINGITRPNLDDKDGKIIETQQIAFSIANRPNNGKFFSTYNSLGAKVKEITNKTTPDLSLIFNDSSILISDWIKGDQFDIGGGSVDSPAIINNSKKLSNKFIYTFQYNAYETSDKDNIDATYGIQSFDEAQSNNQYEPKEIPDPTDPTKKIIVYNKTILNRLGNIISNKVINVDDLSSGGDSSSTIKPAYFTLSRFLEKPTSEENLKPFVIDSGSGSTGVISYTYYYKYEPYIDNTLDLKMIFELEKPEEILESANVWCLGGFASSLEPNAPFSKKMYLLDAKGEIENIKMTLFVQPNSTSGNKWTWKWDIKYKTEEIIDKTTFTAKEFNLDNFNKMENSFSLKIDEYDFLNEEIFYNKNSKFNYKFEPQIYMSHCFQRTFNYLGAGKEIPFEIFGNDYTTYIQQLITPSTAIDNIFITTNEIKGRLMLSNGGIKTEYNNSLPSVSDSFTSYMQQNASQINNSYLTSQGNLQYAKQQQTSNILKGIVGVGGGAIGMGATSSISNSSSMETGTHKAGDINYTDAGGNLVGSIKQSASSWSRPITSQAEKTMLGLGSAKQVMSGIFQIADAIIGGNKAIFNAEQQIKQIESFVKDTYNSPDEMIYSSSSVQDIENYYDNINKLFENNVSNNGLIRALELYKLPTIAIISEYANEINQHGYISNRLYYSQNIDTLINRKIFNYIQLGDIQNMFKDINLNATVKGYFMNLFNNGVRIWNNDYEMLDYSNENWENSFYVPEPLKVLDIKAKRPIIAIRNYKEALQILDNHSPNYNNEVIAILSEIFDGEDLSGFSEFGDTLYKFENFDGNNLITLVSSGGYIFDNDTDRLDSIDLNWKEE